MQNIIIIGSGGHAVSCIDVILSAKKFKIQGYISDKPNPDLPKSIKNFSVPEDKSVLEDFIKTCPFFSFGIGASIKAISPDDKY